jgi:hypothetical protein
MMQKFNLNQERISVKKVPLMQAINSGKTFGITHLGEVVYPPYHEKDIFIFKGSMKVETSAFAIAKERGLTELFGNLYKIKETHDSIEIDASGAWGEIVGFNQQNASYDDSTSDGIMDLGDAELEEMSWHATEFGISNRDISDVIEKECEGILFCLHKEEPFLFSSLIFIEDIHCAREKVRAYITKVIEEKIESDPEFARDNLTDDEEEAALFFGII